MPGLGGIFGLGHACDANIVTSRQPCDAGCPPFMAGQATGQPGSRATTLEIYRKIVGGQLSIPTHINPSARVRQRTCMGAVSSQCALIVIHGYRAKNLESARTEGRRGQWHY